MINDAVTSELHVRSYVQGLSVFKCCKALMSNENDANLLIYNGTGTIRLKLTSAPVYSTITGVHSDLPVMATSAALGRNHDSA